MQRFPDNLNRLLGMHNLTAREAAQILGLSQSTFAKWGTGLRQPSFATALKVGEFFGVPADRLATAEFTDLLENELGNPERFQNVEKKIQYARAGLKPVDELEAGKMVDIATGKPVPSRGPGGRKRR
jgi:transcriptional regulator with XRE-family HTH domain